ncbi:hypothetical protein ON010_g8101 [Phytophthora cinnamomi]|nr:hypothetical protein ON010_g8101 [Phytophthora cinnamomi]
MANATSYPQFDRQEPLKGDEDGGFNLGKAVLQSYLAQRVVGLLWITTTAYTCASVNEEAKVRAAAAGVRDAERPREARGLRRKAAGGLAATTGAADRRGGEGPDQAGGVHGLCLARVDGPRQAQDGCHGAHRRVGEAAGAERDGAAVRDGRAVHGQGVRQDREYGPGFRVLGLTTPPGVHLLAAQLQAAALQRQMQRPLIPTANSDQEEGEPALKRVKQEADCELPAASKEGERNAVTPATVCTFEANEIHLGDQYTRFQVQKVAECESARCRSNFQFLEDGIYACRRHGTPHICTFEQCDRQELHMGSYICWVSGKVYGREREEAGTDVRTRRVVYSDAQGDENSVEMEVPVMLPLGKTTEYLLEGDPSGQHSGDVSSLSPPPPDEKAWNKRHRVNSDGCDGNANDDRSPRRETRKKFKRDRGQERETSPVRKRLHQRLAAKIQRSETTSFHIFLKLPPAVAILPKVALELEEAADSSSDDEDAPSKAPADKSTKERLLQIFVNSHHTVNYIKYWMEELTEQQLSIWDQQIYWGDTLIGEETNVMVLEEHGISAGCVLELRLHDDCPLLVSTWNGKNAVAGGGGSAPMEYNTVQISKEAAEDLDDLQEEWENVVAAEEQAFELSRLKRKREKLELRGAIEHTEVLRYDNAKSEPRLLGVIQKRAIGDGDGGKQKRQLIPPSTARELDGKAAQQKALVSIKSEILIKEEQEQVPKGVQALRSLSNDAQPVKEAKKAQAKTKK